MIYLRCRIRIGWYIVMKLCNKKLFLLDMDGTLYLGNRIFDKTREFLSRIRIIGAKYLFLTNNSSKSASAYVKKLAKMGIDACEEDFFTSTNATITYLKKQYGESLIYASGTHTFVDELRAYGLNVTVKPKEGIKCFVMGYDTELTYEKLMIASRLLINKEIDYIATNPDLVCPTEFGYVPDCGSVAQMLFNATGRLPKFIGKPEPEMILESMEKCSCSADETVIIGDRLYTDIAAGVNAETDTVFVLSGEGVTEDIEKYGIRPTYVMRDIGEVLSKL